MNAPALSNRIDILPALKAKYPRYLKPDIFAASIVELPGVCFLEITGRLYRHSRDEIIERVDLSIIANGDGDMFPPADLLENNAKRFVEDLDEYSIIMTTPLFSEDGAQEVATESEKRGGKLERARTKNL